MLQCLSNKCFKVYPVYSLCTDVRPSQDHRILRMQTVQINLASGHLNGSIGSNSSTENLDAKDTPTKKKGLMPVKVASNTGQWNNEDFNVVHQLRYKMDLDCFQTYRRNKNTPAHLSTINTKDHSTYIEVAKADPSSVIKISVFSVATYQEVL